MSRPLVRRSAHPRTWVLSTLVIVVGFAFALPGGPWAGTTAPSSAGAGSTNHPAVLDPAGAFHTKVVLNSKDDWPELHQTPLLTGYASNSGLSSLNASKLGV